MEIFEITLLIFAYTLGIITLFLEIICYKRHIEYIETIFLTISFLLLIIAITVTRFSAFYNQPSWLDSGFVLHIPIILLGLSTLFNTLAERKFEPSSFIKYSFIIAFGILFILVFLEYFLTIDLWMDKLVMGYLIISVMYSMMIIRTSKPTARVVHREKIERITALICFIILPVTLCLDLLSGHIDILSGIQSKIGLTLPFLFIFLAGSKLLDDIQRLSLFNTENSLKEQTIQNYNFTPREIDVVELIMKGYTYQQICEALFISMPTVKTHVTNIYKKAQVSNKMELHNLLAL